MPQKTGFLDGSGLFNKLTGVAQRVLLRHFVRNRMHVKLAEEDEVIGTLLSEKSSNRERCTEAGKKHTQGEATAPA